MRVDVSPQLLDVEPGRRAVLSVAVYNDESIIVAYRIRVLGLDEAWVDIDQERLSLFPDTSGVAIVTLNLPNDAPAGSRRIAVEVTSLTEPARTELAEVELTTPTNDDLALEIQPVSIFGTRSGTFGVIATNEGNTPLDIVLEAEDPEDHLHFGFDPYMIEIGPGERLHVQAVVEGRRPLVGSPAPRQFTIRALGTGGAVDPMAMGTLIQRPWLSRGALSLLGLLVAVSVFAGVLTATLGRVVDRSTAGEDLLLQVVRGETGADVVENPATVRGSVTLLTSGAPVDGVTAEIFAADAPDRSIAATATAPDGAFVFGGLAEGTYKLRFRGAGFTEVWYPTALLPDHATEIDVAEGATVSGIDVRLGGIPGSISGRVVGDDPTGASVVLHVSASVIDGPVDAVVTSTVVDATGEFTLADVPAPSTYLLSVDKPGFASEVRVVNIAAGEVIEGVEIGLFEGDGAIGGTVSSADGPVGGATITASSGTTTVATATLTQDAVGTFTLRNLPTPATYTIVVSAQGYADESFAVPLSAGQEIHGLSVFLRGGEGSISGSVSVAGEGPIGGVLVSVSDGDVTLSSRTVSVGDVGSYRIDGIPVPGTYTVTFSHPELATQTRSVDLAPGGSAATGVNATLTRAAATLRGTVSDSASGPLGGVTITMTSGDVTRRTVSAHVPAGRYEIGAIPPGTYTVTFDRSGSQPRAVLVELGPGEVRNLDVTMEPQASISGTVRRPNPDPSEDPLGVVGVTVRLYRLATYPSAPIATRLTDDEGNYTFDGLDAPDNYIVEFVSGAPLATVNVPLSAGEQRTGVDHMLAGP